MRILLCFVLSISFTLEASKISDRKERRRDRIDAAKERARRQNPPPSLPISPGPLSIQGGGDSLAHKIYQLLEEESQRFRVAPIDKTGSALSLKGVGGEKIECDSLVDSYRCILEPGAAVAPGSIPPGKSYRVVLASGLLHDSALGRLFRLLHFSKMATLELHDSAADRYVYSLFDGNDKSVSANTLTCEILPDTGAASRQVDCVYTGVAP